MRFLMASFCMDTVNSTQVLQLALQVPFLSEPSPSHMGVAFPPSIVLEMSMLRNLKGFLVSTFILGSERGVIGRESTRQILLLQKFCCAPECTACYN